jgi:hypothetical protein
VSSSGLPLSSRPPLAVALLLRALLLWALLVLPALASCSSPGVRWEDVDRGGTNSTERAVRGTGAGDGPRASAPRSPPSATEPAAGVLIDRALQDFVSTRVGARQHPKTSAVWTEAWDKVLHRIGRACEAAPRASDLGAFVRARVTLEVELDRDRARGLLLPDDIDRRVRAVLVSVDEGVGELRAANVPGTLAPSPRLQEGELVLRAPVAPMIVSSPFGVRADPFTGARRFHAGVDLDAPSGSTVYSAASGLVVFAGNQGGYGKQVVIDHGDGVRTHYSHLSVIVVDPGQTVEEGDPVARVGSTGRSTGPHLHFAVTNEEGDFLDPAALIDVPWSSIARQVKLGPAKNRRTFSVKNSGDTVEISSVNP